VAWTVPVAAELPLVQDALDRATKMAEAHQA